jgi:hypothetical protein
MPKIMNTITKKSIKSGLIAGIVFAGVTVGFDYYDDQDFRVWRFIFNFLWFGIFMGLLTNYNPK